jgi:dynein heavy chain, axonemal
MEREINRQKLLVLDPQTPNYMTQIEKAIATGMAVILQNVEEELDTNIDPILKKSLKKVAGKLMIILGDKEVLYDPNFRFYMTTKIANPTYKPEVST